MQPWRETIGQVLSGRRREVRDGSILPLPRESDRHIVMSRITTPGVPVSNMQVGSIASLICCVSIIQPCASASSAGKVGESSDDAPLAELLRLQKLVCKRGLMRPALPAPPDDVLQRAIKGEADAEYQLGCWFYEYIVYGEQCVQVCKGWLERAARQEFAEAQWMLGLFYKDYRNDEYVAETWFKKAISNFEKRTDATAYRFLYGMYFHGLGTAVNMEKAKEYALKYAERCKEEKTQPMWGNFSPEMRVYVIEKIGF